VGFGGWAGGVCVCVWGCGDGEGCGGGVEVDCGGVWGERCGGCKGVFGGNGQRWTVGTGTVGMKRMNEGEKERVREGVVYMLLEMGMDVCTTLSLSLSYAELVPRYIWDGLCATQHGFTWRDKPLLCKDRDSIIQCKI